MIDQLDDLTAVSPLLTYKEAGAYLHKSATFVRGEVYAGRLPIKRIGRTPLIERAALDDYISDADTETGASARRPGTGRGSLRCVR